jgi:hypothetical protein
MKKDKQIYKNFLQSLSVGKGGCILLKCLNSIYLMRNSFVQLSIHFFNFFYIKNLLF